MSRFVKTVATADGGGGGGSSDAGMTAAQACQYACKAICDMFCTNMKCPECRPYYNTLPVPTVNDYVVVCHCDCWTNCYGQGMVFCLDTNKYRGFKWCYRGVRVKGCCWWYGKMGMAAKGVDCFCCCNNSYRMSCKCHFPLTQCCNACWQFWDQGYIEIGCMQCCQSQCDGNFNFGWEIFPVWQKSQQNTTRVRSQVGFCVWMPRGNRDPMQCAGGYEIYMGETKPRKNFIACGSNSLYGSMDVYFDGSGFNMQMRDTSGKGTTWQGEILGGSAFGAGAKGGKVGGGILNRILESVYGEGKGCFRNHDVDSAKRAAHGSSLDRMIFNLATDNKGAVLMGERGNLYKHRNPSRTRIAEEIELDRIADADGRNAQQKIQWKFSKFLGLEVVDIMMSGTSQERNDVSSRLYQYAASRSDKSAPFLKVSS